MLVIGIAGGSGSGKTTVVKAITEKLEGKKVVVVPQDSYYKDSSDLTDEEKRVHNFDHPDAIEWDLLCSQLREQIGRVPSGLKYGIIPFFLTYVNCLDSLCAVQIAYGI